MSILPALLLLGAALAASARAAPATYSLDIPAQAMRDALLALALETDISIGGADPAACGNSHAVRGSYTPEAALRAIVAGSRCAVERYDSTTYRLGVKEVKHTASRPSAPPPAEPAKIPAGEVLVVVARRPQPLNSAPSAISVVGRDVLGANDFDLGNLAARVPGMAVTNLGPGRDKILLRGVSDSVITGRTQSIVGLYLDDTPVTYDAPDPDLLLVDMARVEVLKGPQGALYGQGSLSGVVRLVTNKPQAHSLEGMVSAGAGLTEGGRPSSRLTAMLNLPLVRDKLAVRGVLYDEQTGGFINNDMPGARATNSTGRYGGRLALRWDAGAGLTVTAGALVQHLASQNSQYVFSHDSAYHRSLPLAEPHDNNIEDLTFNLEKTGAAGTLTLSLNRIRHKIHTGYDAQPLGPIVTVPNSGVLFYDEDQSIALSTQEISFVSPSQQRLRWLAGVFAATDVERFTPHLVDVFTGKTLYNEDRRDGTRDMALFGQMSYDFTPRLTVSLGLRADSSRHETFSQINHVRLTNYERMGDVVGTINAHHLTHSLVVSYGAAPGLVVYAQTADGYRTGGFNTTTLSLATFPSRYGGDHLDNYETGLRWRTADSRLRLDIAAFVISWQNIQSDQLRSTGLPVTLNLGDGGNTGLELEADWRTGQTLTFHAAAQVNNPRLDHPDPLFSKDQDSGMPYIAKTSFSLSANWEQRLAGRTLSNSIIFSYRSKSPLNYGKLREVRMGGLANLDLSSSFRAGFLTWGARLDNAAAARGNSFAYGNPFSLDGSNQITPLRPRTLWLTVSRDF